MKACGRGTGKIMIKKILILLFIIVLVAAFFIFDLNHYLSLAYLKESRMQFASFYAENTILTIAVYIMIYIAITALSLPGAAIMTLAGGAMFGFIVGVIAASFASTMGASLAFLVSRYILRGWVEKKLGDRLAAINAGIEKEGGLYLLSLRLIPVFPFWIINLLMGLTRMKLVTFYWVSQVGMLAGTMVYVNAGKELGKINSLSGILSPGLIASFIILGLFPLGMKKAMNIFRMYFRKEDKVKSMTGKEI
jgi:uncharacterized membrane protein YdjX (TVP38/TMEM64 family)